MSRTPSPADSREEQLAARRRLARHPVILIAAASGYVALAAFLAEQIIWIGVVLVFAILLSIIIDEAIGRGLSSEGRLGRQVRSAVGLKSGSIDQISILSSGVLKVILIIVALFMILAPWGIDSGDLTGYIKAGFFGFSVAASPSRSRRLPARS